MGLHRLHLASHLSDSEPEPAARAGSERPAAGPLRCHSESSFPSELLHESTTHLFLLRCYTNHLFLLHRILLPLHLAKNRDQPLLICSLHRPLDEYTTILSDAVFQLGFEYLQTLQEITNTFWCTIQVAPSHRVATWTYMPQQLGR